ncbi:MAG: hypothetical protein WCA85_10165 [Paraburkholderia sp.]|uniref:hypothetical protein n=1 Tax=Paraburkholderia sp. TaxID=1926495 RepID=UPI003C62D674
MNTEPEKRLKPSQQMWEKMWLCSIGLSAIDRARLLCFNSIQDATDHQFLNENGDRK